jgi:pyruvate formate lyase activating enzyme
LKWQGKNKLVQANYGDSILLSTVDWIGLSSTVIFLRGCPLRCPHCQNYNLQKGDNIVSIYNILKTLMKTKPDFGDNASNIISPLEEAIRGVTAEPLVSAIILSGGEPLMQPEVIRALSPNAKNLGLKIGIETSGCYPKRLRKLIKEGALDKVFLDIKAALRDPEYYKATGVPNVAPRVLDSLRICMESSTPLEIRTTVFPGMPSVSDVKEIAEAIFAFEIKFPNHKFESMVIQQGLPINEEFEPIAQVELENIAKSIEALVNVRVRTTSKRKKSKRPN